MNDKRVDFRKLNDAKRGLMFRGLGIGVVLYWLIKDIVLPYLAGGEGAPTLGQLILGIAVLGGGAIFIALISWKAYKLAKENAYMTDEEIAEMEALREGEE